MGQQINSDCVLVLKKNGEFENNINEQINWSTVQQKLLLLRLRPLS